MSRTRVLGGKHIQGGGLNASIGLILKSYSDDVKESVNKECHKTAKKLLKQVKKDSPKVTGGYADGWNIRRQDIKSGGRYSVSYIRYVIYNKWFWLPHLLEYGHVNRNGTRAKATPHIDKNREDAREELIENIKEVLSD